ncbi:sensor histidine kinase [Actinoplanes sp. M2I2]|uniref:sensor histidine kinase n=1 Tax=Actinoplanes sp. M2I2 TaxID=1734444 RepID=UPI002021CFFB|nr:sensor histidine kinase [Actinoplanes sp. M2I2]
MSSTTRKAYEVTLALLVAGSIAAIGLLVGLPPAAVAALAGLDLALVAARRKYPAAALLVFAAVLLATGRPDGLALVVLSWSAGYRLRPGRLSAVLAATAVLYVTGSWLHNSGGITGLAFQAGIFVVFAILPAVVARMSAQRQEILVLLHERTVHLAGQQRVIAEQARVREAHRIAREMHDSLGHRLTLLTLYAGALEAGGKPDGETLGLLHTTSRSAIDELRLILDVLRDESPVDPQRAGLAHTDDLVADARSAGADIELAREGEPVELPVMVEHAAYRTLQEGVTNALKHARGGRIRLALRYEDGTVIAEVVNGPGRPHDGPTGGQGLYGLAERVRLAGGVLYHGPEPDGGFRIAATLPLTASAPPTREPWPAVAAPAVVDDVGEALRRADRRRRAWIGGIVAGVVAVGVLCAGGAMTFWLHISVDQETYDSVRVGDSEAAVREKLPDPDWAQVTVDPAPGCVTYNGELGLSSDRSSSGYRFCFRDGALVSKEPIDDAGQ